MKTVEMKPYKRQTWLKPEVLHRATFADFRPYAGNPGVQLSYGPDNPLTWVRCPHDGVVGVARIENKWHWVIDSNDVEPPQA